VSHTLISNVTEAVEAERKLWQNRSLDAVYPIVYLDAIGVKVRHEGQVINKAIHLALGVNLAGQKELLELWITQNESSKFWLSVLTELQNREVKDIFIACVDGLSRFPAATPPPRITSVLVTVLPPPILPPPQSQRSPQVSHPPPPTAINGIIQLPISLLSLYV
jgi:hypothetical protein